MELEITKEKQTALIIEYIEEHGSITDIQATELGIRRLAARIWDIRHLMGIPVKDAWEYKYDDRGKIIKKWKVYWI